MHTRGKPLAPDVDLSLIAPDLGLTGADLANLCNEAAIFADRQERTTILAEDFDGAMERVVAGPAATARRLREGEARILAYHEAGHALMSHLMGDLFPAQKVTIISRGQALGYTLNMPSEDATCTRGRSSST